MSKFPMVRIYDSGAAEVVAGNSEWTWSKEAVDQAVEVAKVCCESRRSPYPRGLETCGCTCCLVALEVLRKKLREPEEK